MNDRSLAGRRDDRDCPSQDLPLVRDKHYQPSRMVVSIVRNALRLTPSRSHRASITRVRAALIHQDIAWGSRREPSDRLLDSVKGADTHDVLPIAVELPQCLQPIVSDLQTKLGFAPPQRKPNLLDSVDEHQEYPRHTAGHIYGGSRRPEAEDPPPAATENGRSPPSPILGPWTSTAPPSGPATPQDAPGNCAGDDAWSADRLDPDG